MALPLSAESKASLERPCSARDLSSLRIKSGAPVGLNVPQCADIWKTLSRSASWSSPGVQLLGITCAIWPSVGSGKIFLWREGDTSPRRLQELTVKDKGVKPEVLLVLGETPTAYRALVMCDGVAGGSPAEYQIRKE